MNKIKRTYVKHMTIESKGTLPMYKVYGHNSGPSIVHCLYRLDASRYSVTTLLSA